LQAAGAEPDIGPPAGAQKKTPQKTLQKAKDPTMASDTTRDRLDDQPPHQTPGTTGIETGEPVAANQGEALPRPDARRWYRRDKRKVIAAVRRGALGFREACRRYRLSYEEFVSWERIAAAHIPAGAIRQDNERRGFHRVALRSPASLRVGGRRVDCEIENLSATGALLMVGESRSYPSQVALEVPHSKDALPARIAWRGRNSVGIAFAAGPSVVAARLNNRWIEGATALRDNTR
jgi:hypothetical protein